MSDGVNNSNEPSRAETASEAVGRNDPISSASGRVPPTLIGRFGRLLKRTVPSLAVIAMLLGIGAWGHHTDWKAPKFSELTGSVANSPDDWCEEHNVPESECLECNPGQFPEYPKPDADRWCKEHGVHLCPLDHPEIAELKEAPSVSQADFVRAERALELRPRAENNFACTFYRRRVQFASRDAVLKAGIDVEPVFRRRIVEAIDVVGEIRYDETRLARLSPKAAGTAWQVERQIGDRVEAGDVLAFVDAADVGRAKSELIAALADERLYQANYNRLEGLTDSGAISGKQFLEVQAALQRARSGVLSAQQTLVNLGLPVNLDELRRLPEDGLAARLRFLSIPRNYVSALDADTTTSNLLPLRAPLDGEVVARSVVAGEVVDTSHVLFEIADTSRMWLMLNVPIEQMRYVHTGQPVQFRQDDGELVEGKVSWISTAADQKTRTVQVRADLPNPDGRLRNETFGTGKIVLREEPEAMVVPNAAVQWDGSCHIVFVRDKRYFEKGGLQVFHVRTVRLGAKTDNMTELIVGVLPGEVVATTGADVLRAQLLKNNLGAG